MQINRLLEIVYILLDKKNCTATELARHFGVSRRTICRDIDVLSSVGIPIYTERGQGGGIRLLPDFVLDKSILSEREQSEILYALQGLSNVMTEDTGQILQKLSTVFSKTAIPWLAVDFTGWSYEKDDFNAFKAAILEQKVVTFSYYNRHGDKTHRRVEPMQLWFKGRSWYLKAFCLSKQAPRLYKLPCIKNLVVTEESYARRENFELAGHSLETMFENQNILDIQLRIAPERAHRVFEDFYEDMVEKQPDGSFLIQVSWPEDQWLYGFILSFGRHVEVLSPPALRQTIREEAQFILQNHL